MTIQQVKTKKVRTTFIMSRACFVRGFKEAQQGKPFVEEMDEGLAGQWGYERGRLFGTIYKGALKQGIHVTREARLAYSAAVAAGEIL